MDNPGCNPGQENPRKAPTPTGLTYVYVLDVGPSPLGLILTVLVPGQPQITSGVIHSQVLWTCFERGSFPSAGN
jgi:hypothetical protein